MRSALRRTSSGFPNSASTRQNSSGVPEVRATRSPARSPRAIRSPILASSVSPAGAPWKALICPNLSRSIITTAKPRADSRFWIKSRIARSQSSRFGRPVRPSEIGAREQVVLQSAQGLDVQGGADAIAGAFEFEFAPARSTAPGRRPPVRRARRSPSDRGRRIRRSPDWRRSAFRRQCGFPAPPLRHRRLRL